MKQGFRLLHSLKGNAPLAPGGAVLSHSTRSPAWLLILSLLLCLHPIPRGLAAQAEDWQVKSSRRDRFTSFELWIDSAAAPVAAYQVKIITKRGTVKLIGVEGGDPPAFRAPPHYDPKALQRDRILLGAFSLKPPAELPSGLHRMAQIHVQIPANSDPQFEVTVIAAADSEGRALPIKASIKRHPSP